MVHRSGNFLVLNAGTFEVTGDSKSRQAGLEAALKELLRVLEESNVTPSTADAEDVGVNLHITLTSHDEQNGFALDEELLAPWFRLRAELQIDG